MAEIDKRSPVFDWDKGDFVKTNQNAVATVTGGEALKQIAIKAVSTVRGVYAIYADVDDEDRNHTYGNDTVNVLRQDISEEVRMEEIRRAIRESLIYDPWITDVYEIEITRTSRNVQVGTEADAGYASLKLSTIFDKEVVVEGVSLNG